MFGQQYDTTAHKGGEIFQTTHRKEQKKMAIRTNSKKAHERIQAYILANMADEIAETNEWNAANGDPKRYDPESITSVCGYILDEFARVCAHEFNRRRRIADIFQEYTQGLPMHLYDYWYCYDAKPILGEILEETETERNRFTEQQACECLTTLIYNECLRVTKRLIF